MLVSRRTAVGLLAALPVAFAPAALGQPGVRAKPNPSKAGPPTALVVAHARYPNLPKEQQVLARTAEYAAELAARLEANGYQVEVVTDSDSLDTVKAKLKGGKAAVRAEDGGDQVTEAIEGWMKRSAEAAAPLSLLVLTGHGAERDGVPHLLAAGDKGGAGGVSVGRLKEAAAKLADWPLVVVFDACRTPPPELNVKPDAPPPADPKVVKELPASDPKRLLLADEVVRVTPAGDPPAGGRYPTVLYSTVTGKKADADQDLVCHLARGLKGDEAVRRFLAWAHAGGPARRDDELSLRDWFHFGLAGLLGTTDLKQRHEIEVGSVPLSAVVARSVKGKWGPPDRGAEVIDLTGRFDPQWGQFRTALGPRGGLTVTHPEGNLPAKEMYADGLVGGDKGFDPRGRTLVLELVAAPPPKADKGKNPPAYLACEIHPKWRKDETASHYLSPQQEAYKLPYDRLMTVTLPLNAGVAEGVALNDLGFAAPQRALGLWPAGAAVTIAGMKLVRTPDRAVAGTAPLDLNLLPLWQPGARLGGTADAPRLAVRPSEKTDAPYALELDGGAKGQPAACGGPLVRDTDKVYVPDNQVLVVEVENTGGAEAALTVELAWVDTAAGKVERLTDPQPHKLAAKAKTKLAVPLTAAGYANYLALTADGPGLRLTAATVQPAPKAVGKK